MVGELCEGDGKDECVVVVVAVVAVLALVLSALLGAESQRRARTALVCYATRYEDGKLPAFFLLLNVPSRSRFSAFPTVLTAASTSSSAHDRESPLKNIKLSL